MTRRLVLLIGTCLAAWASTFSVSLGADEQVIQEVSANGTRNLRPFTIKDHWEVRWESKGAMLSITAYRHDPPVSDPLAKMPIAVGMQEGAGKGSSYLPTGGSYYLQVSGMGDWIVTVVQLP